jgi:hypothetical protein
VQTRGVAKREFPDLLGHDALFDQLERFRHDLPKIGYLEEHESELNTGRIFPKNWQLPRSFAVR